MLTLIPPHFVLEDVTRNDIIIASLAWGFTIGFGWLTISTALKQTKQTWKRQKRRTFRNAYIWMIWLEVLVCLIFGVICFLYLLHFIPPSFAFYFTICEFAPMSFYPFPLPCVALQCATFSTFSTWHP